VKSALATQPLLLDLGPAVKSAGFAVVDHEALIAELAALVVEGMPGRALAKRQAEFLAGRFAARRALAALGLDFTPARNDDGSPRWPPAIAGSITHGAERALCAVAHATEVRSLGIDAERLMKPSASAELRARICRDDERAVMAKSIGSVEHHLVTFAFSAKESLYKCLYPLVGQFMEFHAARVVAAVGSNTSPGLAGELTLELSVDWSPEFRRGRQFCASFVASEQHVESAVLLWA
jgi:enterobactin synthetase component D